MHSQLPRFLVRNVNMDKTHQQKQTACCSLSEAVNSVTVVQLCLYNRKLTRHTFSTYYVLTCWLYQQQVNSDRVHDCAWLQTVSEITVRFDVSSRWRCMPLTLLQLILVPSQNNHTRIITQFSQRPNRLTETLRASEVQSSSLLLLMCAKIVVWYVLSK